MLEKNKKILTIGGGTGNSNLLFHLKNYYQNLSTIVNMVDNGGSTGILRKELNVLPMGDLRQCLFALSGHNEKVKKILNYRFNEGFLKHHTFGNIMLAAMEKISDDYQIALDDLGLLFKTKGRIIPIFVKPSNLVALTDKEKVIGEQNIFNSDLNSLLDLRLEPKATINPVAKKAILEAHKIIIAPGDMYSSIIPIFLTRGFEETLRKSKAKIIWVCNLMYKKNHFDNYTVFDYFTLLQKYLSRVKMDCCLYNTDKLNKNLLKKYSRQGEYLIEPGPINAIKNLIFIGEKLISYNFPKQKAGDIINRTLIKHDGDKLAKLIYKI